MKRFAPLSVAGALLLMLCAAAGLYLDSSLFFAAWLAAWWFWGGVMLGAAANAHIHTLTGGRWGEVIAKASKELQRPALGWLLLFLPMLAGVHRVYPWSSDPVAWTATMTQPGFVQAWFTLGFFGLRLLAYGAVFWWLLRQTGGRGPGRAALALIIYMAAGSLAASDLLMSLVSGWSSSVFGWLALIGQLAAGMAAASVLALLRGEAAGGSPPLSRDLGNLLLMYVMLQAYLQFMQLLVIWAENLPREISWYLPRFQTGWWLVGIALVLLQFAAPFVALLWRSIKDRPQRLGAVASLFLAAQALGTAWLSVPSVQPRGYLAWALIPATVAGMGALLFGRLAPRARPDHTANRWTLERADERS